MLFIASLSPTGSVKMNFVNVVAVSDKFHFLSYTLKSTILDNVKTTAYSLWA